MSPTRPALAAVLFTLGCGGSPSASRPAPVEATPAPPAPREPAHAAAPTRDATPAPAPLPAGLYFRNAYLDNAIDDPTDPRVAVVAGIARDPARARERAEALEAAALAPGYPLVVHTDELGLAETTEGIAVVAALFATADEAAAWVDASGIAEVRVAALLDDAAYRDRLLDLRDDGSDWARPRYRVARIAPRGEPVAAYPRKAIETAEDAHRRWRDERGPDPLVNPPDAVCEIAPGTVFVIDDEIAAYPGHRWTPVTCGDRPVYVRHSDTLLDTVFVAQPGGSARVHQIAGVECDMAWFRSWTEEPDGARAPFELGGHAGC